MEFREDDPRAPQAANMLRDHLAEMARITPPESIHALDIESLCGPSITFWTAWEGDEMVGCGALRELDSKHGEIKSMHTAESHLRQGIASGLLKHIIEEAKRRSYTQISLETGAKAAFAPAHALYKKHGFDFCGPFADYNYDPNSVFMTRML